MKTKCKSETWSFKVQIQITSIRVGYTLHIGEFNTLNMNAAVFLFL